MTNTEKCTNCNNPIPLSAERCPHCALPGLFPNVRAAGGSDERNALEQRYLAAMKRALKRGCNNVVNDFENSTEKSVAVIARSVNEVQRLANSENEIYATYYQYNDSGIRLPKGDKWDILRSISDDVLFPGYKENIRFAALSLDGTGLTNYGECCLILKEDMIKHRASVFEENSITFMKNHKIQMPEAHKLPKGYRAKWSDRGKLCVAKLADKIEKDTTKDEYQNILLQEGKTSANDKFVEVHICGPMTILTFEKVRIKRPTKRITSVILSAIKDKLKKANVSLEVI